MKQSLRVLPTTAAFGTDGAPLGFPFRLSGFTDRREYHLVAEVEASRRIWIQVHHAVPSSLA